MHLTMRYAVGRVILVYLLCALALAGTALAAPPGKTTYRVVNLVPGDVASVAINAHGQVAYTVNAPWPGPGPGIGPSGSWFYDGARSINIGDDERGFRTTSGLNDAGQVVGFGQRLPGRSGVFVWSRARGHTELGLLPATDRLLLALINNQGVVAGNAAGPDSVNRAFRWTRTGGMEDLGALGQDPSLAYVSALNDAGAITGTSWARESDYHAFLWTRATGMVDIHTNDSDDSTPTGISARGHVAGNYHYDGPDWRGYVWTPATGMRDLNPGGVVATAQAMSASGQVTGSIGTFETGFHAMTWTRAGGLLDLGTFGGANSQATAANNRGQVVGHAQAASAGDVRAFAWTAQDGKIDLNTRLRHAPPGLRLDMALAISDNGAIVARSNAGLVLLKPERGTGCSCPHTVGPIAANAMVALGAPLEVAVSVAGPAPGAPYRVTWDWGDGSTRLTTQVAAGSGGQRARAVHSYATPGIHTVTATVTDRSGNGVAVSRKIVARPVGAGVAAGAGAFVAPYTRDGGAPVHPGIARLYFIAPTGADARAGARAALQVDIANLHFASQDLAPVAVAVEGGVARFTGSGAVNGKAGYRFTLEARASHAGADGPGRIRLRIWRADPATGRQALVYDNGRDSRARGDAGDAGGSALTEGGIAL